MKILGILYLCGVKERRGTEISPCASLSRDDRLEISPCASLSRDDSALYVPRASRQSPAIGGRGGGFLMEDVRNPEEKQLFSIVFNGKIWKKSQKGV